MELLLKHVVVSLNLINIHILIITTWSKKEKEVKCFALQTQTRFSIHSQWLQKTVMVREKMVLIECYFWSTHPVCPRSAAWWSAPLPLLSFWFILAPFCKRNSQAGNDPLRKKNNNFITWFSLHCSICWVYTPSIFLNYIDFRFEVLQMLGKPVFFRIPWFDLHITAR